jgi:leucyl aminopeptidase
MLAKLMEYGADISAKQWSAVSHGLIVLPKSDKLPADKDLLGAAILNTLLTRRGMQPAELAETPLAGETGHGGLAVWVMLDASANTFEQHTVLRKAVQLLLNEKPAEISIAVVGSAKQKQQAAEMAAYVCWVNATPMPSRKFTATNLQMALPPRWPRPKAMCSPAP